MTDQTHKPLAGKKVVNSAISLKTQITAYIKLNEIKSDDPVSKFLNDYVAMLDDFVKFEEANDVTQEVQKNLIYPFANLLSSRLIKDYKMDRIEVMRGVASSLRMAEDGHKWVGKYDKLRQAYSQCFEVSLSGLMYLKHLLI